MKKHSKVFKALTLLLCLIICGVGVRMDVVAANTILTTEYGCGKTLCFKDVMISGPYGNPDELINSSVPYVGGMKYKDAYQLPYMNTSDDYQDEHMYVIYCPKYDNSDGSLLRHTMVLMCADHGFTTKSYTQYSSVYHYANKICDYAPDLRDNSTIRSFYQGLSGENAYLSEEDLYAIAEKYQSTTGCGIETSVLEGHTWTYGDWYSAGGSYHTRTATCIHCGYSKKVSENHTLSTTDWKNSSESEHKRTTACTVCDYSNTEYANHQFTYGAWENSSGTQHKRTATCSTCGYSKTEYANHNLTKSDGIYYGSDSDPNYNTYPGTEYHRYDTSCSDCSYKGSQYELHEMYVRVPWYKESETHHRQITQCYHCAYSVSSGKYHTYPQSLYTYEPIDETLHQITKYCDTCTQVKVDGTAKHNFVVGEWTKFDGSDPNAGTYDCNKYHKRTLTCSDCGYVKYEYVEHNIQIDEYTVQNADRHSCVPKCTDCSYSYNLNEPHTFNPEDYKYEVIDKDYHLFIKPCEKCSYAYEAREYHEDSDSDCYCDDCGYLMTKFSVTVPTTMVLTMGTDGKVYSPSDVVIVNNSTAAVSVTKADLFSQNGWNIVPYSTNMANEKVDSKKIGFEMNGIQTDSAGTSDSLSYNNEWTIERDNSSAVVYDAVVSATSSPIDEQVIEVVFIVDWKE